MPTPTPVPTATPIPNTPPTIANPGSKSYEQGEAITAFDITVTDAEDTPTVTISGLPSGLFHGSGQVSGTIPSDAVARDYAVTIFADDGSNPAVSVTFIITVTPNAPPVITNPGGKSYYQGESITAFYITVTDAEDNPTVTVSGLPSGLTYKSGQVSGTISSDAGVEDYAVTISANDGSNPTVSVTFIITVTPNTPPVITNPGNKSYYKGKSITAFDVTVTDAEDTLSVNVSGLPSGLTYESGQVSGTISSDAAVGDYTVTISANDGFNPAISATFTIAVTPTPIPTGQWMTYDRVQELDPGSWPRLVARNVRHFLHVDCGDDDGPGPLRVYISVDENTQGIPYRYDRYADVKWRVDGPANRTTQSTWDEEKTNIAGAGLWIYSFYHAPYSDNREIVNAMYAGATQFEWAVIPSDPDHEPRWRTWDITGFAHVIQPVLDDCPGVTLPS